MSVSLPSSSDSVHDFCPRVRGELRSFWGLTEPEVGREVPGHRPKRLEAPETLVLLCIYHVTSCTYKELVAWMKYEGC